MILWQKIRLTSVGKMPRLFMKLIMNRILIFISTVLFSLEAHVSGTEAVSSIIDCVFVELRIGLRIQRDANDRAYQSNQNRLAEANQEAQVLAKKVKAAIDEFRKPHPKLEFLPMPKEYQFYDDGRAGYARFSTLVTDEEAKLAQGKPSYFQVHKDPRVVLNFKALPSLDVLNDLKAAVRTAVAPK